MAITLDTLKNVVINNLVLGGKDKTVVTAMIDSVLDAGIGMFWRERAWTFALKSDTFNLVVSTPSYDCPTDCDAVTMLKRESTSTADEMIEMPSHVFDYNFPYPTGEPAGSSIYYKVEVTNGTQKIYVMPISDATVVVRRTYKIKYKQDVAIGLIPADYMATIISACLFQALPAGSGDRFAARGAAMQEYQMMLTKAVNLDKVSLKKLTQTQGKTRGTVNPNSWQFYLGEYEDA